MAISDIFTRTRTGRTPDFMPRPRYVRKLGRRPYLLIGDDPDDQDPAASLPLATPVSTPADVVAAPAYTRPRRVEGVDPATLVRPRGVTPRFSDDPLERIPAEIAFQRQNPAPNRNSRWTSIGLAALDALAGGGGDGSLGGLVGRALGGAAVGAIRPETDERIAQQEYVRRLGGEFDEVAAQRKVRGELEGQEATRQERLARAEQYRRGKPTYRKQGGITYQVNPDGTATPMVGPGGEALAPDYQRPATIDALSDDGVSVGKLQFNPRTNKYEPVTVDGEPVVTRRVERVSPETGVRAGTEAAIRQRTTEGAATRAVRVSEGALNRGARATEGAANRAVRRQTAGGVGSDSKRRTQAASAIAKLSGLIRQHDTALESQKPAIAAEAKRQGDLIRAQFPDLVDDGDRGLPTVLRPAPQYARPAQGGLYRGRRMSRSKLPEAARGLGMTPEDAEAYITGQGGIIY